MEHNIVFRREATLGRSRSGCRRHLRDVLLVLLWLVHGLSVLLDKLLLLRGALLDLWLTQQGSGDVVNEVNQGVLSQSLGCFRLLEEVVDVVEDSSSNDGGSQDLGLAGINLKLGASPVNCAGAESLDRPEVVSQGVSEASAGICFSFQSSQGRHLGSGQGNLLGAQNPLDILATARSGQTSLN